MAARLRRQPDGRAQLYLLRDALVQKDPLLDEAKKPTCTEEEFDGYIWDTSNNRKQGEEPLKQNDHGLDALRYLVAHFDLGPNMVLRLL